MTRAAEEIEQSPNLIGSFLHASNSKMPLSTLQEEIFFDSATIVSNRQGQIPHL
jgi:hypothetical protein